MKILVLKFVLLCSILAVSSAEAARIHFFDIDGTLVHDSGKDENGKLPAWWTYWVLPLMSFVPQGFSVTQYNTYKEQGLLPPQILVNRHEIDLLVHDKLAIQEGVSRSPVKVNLLSDPIDEVGNNPFFREVRPKIIVPGYYLINPNVTWRYHDDHASGVNNLLVTYEAAKARTLAAPDRYEWRGRAFKFLQQALLRQGPNERITFITDRATDEKAVMEWLLKMYHDGYIPNPIAHTDSGDIMPKVISTTTVQGRNYGPLDAFFERKSNALEERTSAISRSPLQKHLTLDPDWNRARNKEQRLMHEIIYYENNPDYIKPSVAKFRALSANFSDFKFTLYHAGPKEQVAGADFNSPGYPGRPSRWLIFTPADKGYRKPLPEELVSLEGASPSEPLLCKGVFGAIQ